MRRVVITGMGIWSCLGTDLQTVTSSLKAGKSGIGIDNSRIAYGYQSPLTGIVPEADLKGLLPRRQRLSLSEEASYAYMAALQALRHSQMDEEYLKEHETGIIFGNDSSAQAVINIDAVMRETRDTHMLGAEPLFQALNSSVTMNLGSIFSLSGISFTVSAACASGSHAVGLSYLLIRDGLQDRILCGGAQEVNEGSMTSFDALDVFSKHTADPKAASRPFDRDRDGLIPSGGAAALMLEDYDTAIERGATVLAEIVGYGFSSNGTMSKPSAEGSYTAMSRALKMAGTTPEEVDYINAHATSTPQGDAAEAQAIARLFENCDTPVSSTKGMTGHECWMSGASEAVYSILMMQNSFIAPNLNFEHPDDYSAKLNIISECKEQELNTVVSNSFGFGGTNSALVLKKYNP